MKVVIYGRNLYAVYSQISCLKQRTFVVFLAQARPLWKKNLFNNDSISDLWSQKLWHRHDEKVRGKQMKMYTF